MLLNICYSTLAVMLSVPIASQASAVSDCQNSQTAAARTSQAPAGGEPAATSGVSLDDQYVLGPDSQLQAGIPEGKVVGFAAMDSKAFPGFAHEWWLYIPAQYDGKDALAVMVFLDGRALIARDGYWRVPIVLNNLIARKALPLMAAIFVDPGTTAPLRAVDGSPLLARDNRSVEYDTLSSAYATFVADEILPQVRQYVRITDDPAGHGIGGHSSGGVGAFTVAWQRPDQFSKVLSFSGSFTNIRGGHVYPDLVREADRKPLRVFQQVGAHDMVVPQWGVWLDANEAMAAALGDKGYDHKFVLGEGTHSPKHAAAVFPEAMRWLWRDYPR